MPRIVLVGAGSVEFTRNLLGDFLSYPELRDAEIVLHDIDADRLATAERMARWTAGALGAEPTIRGSLDRREALAGADFVVNTIQVGGARATQIDFDVPARFGLRYTINDTINVGGVLRGLRTIPVVLGIAVDMADVCPEAAFLNYTNPMGMLVKAVDEAIGLPTVGLCHSVYWTVHRLAEYLGVPFAEVDALSAGVNHLAWILRLEHRGNDLYPALHAFVGSGRVPDDDLVRADLFRRFGFYPTESSEHHAEYNPWFIPKGQVDAFHVPIGEYLVARGQQPRRVRRDEAPARRRRAVRDRAQRGVRRGHRPRHDDAASPPGSWRTCRTTEGGSSPTSTATPASRSRPSSTGWASTRSPSGRCRPSAPRTPGRPSTASC